MKLLSLLIGRWKQNQIFTLLVSIFKLRIAGAEGEAATDKSRRVAPTRDVEALGDGNEIRGGGTVAEPDHGENLPVRLEILPGAGRRTAEHEFEAEGSGVPRLIREGGLLVLSVEGADGGEGDRFFFIDR